MVYNFVIGIFLVSFPLLHAQTQLQSLEPASGWYTHSDTSIPTRKEWMASFVKDCAKHSHNNDTIPLHVTNNTTVRIASYNIHFWCKPEVVFFNYATGINRHTYQDITSNFGNIVSILKAINADIICLQELLMFDVPLIERTLSGLGYTYVCFFHEADWAGSSFCVAIASKYPFCGEPRDKIFNIDHAPNAHPFEKHGFLRATLSLPHDKKITIYTSHFDCSDDSENIRYKEVQEIIENATQSTPDNYIVCGDFNAVRAQDLQYPIGQKMAWDLLNRDNVNRTKMPTQTKALDLFTKHGFEDCFSKAQISMPKFSVWNGTVVDFIFLNQHWALPIEGCYFYYTSASDHLPVIFDIKV